MNVRLRLFDLTIREPAAIFGRPAPPFSVHCGAFFIFDCWAGVIVVFIFPRSRLATRNDAPLRLALGRKAERNPVKTR